MSETLKTKYFIPNDDDFVECDGTMRELTVTITLHEYRSLITENAQFAADIDAQKKEIENLTDQNKKLSQAVLASDGGKMFKDIVKAAVNTFGTHDDETEE